MKLEYWKKTGMHPGAMVLMEPEWCCHFISGARITFSASGYDSKAGAITAMCNHAISLRAMLDESTVKAMAPKIKQDIRARVRAQAKERV